MRYIGLIGLSGIMMLGAASSASACAFHDFGYYGEADALAAVDYTGKTYSEQIAAQEEAIRRYQEEQALKLEKAKAVFAARFKVDPAPVEMAEK